MLQKCMQLTAIFMIGRIADSMRIQFSNSNVATLTQHVCNSALAAPICNSNMSKVAMIMQQL